MSEMESRELQMNNDYEVNENEELNVGTERDVEVDLSELEGLDEEADQSEWEEPDEEADQSEWEEPDDEADQSEWEETDDEADQGEWEEPDDEADQNEWEEPDDEADQSEMEESDDEADQSEWEEPDDEADQVEWEEPDDEADQSLDIQTDFEVDEFLNISDFEDVETKPASKCTWDPGILTIINSKGNGKRISIANQVWDKFQKTDKLQVICYRNGIAIGKEVPNSTKFFNVKKSGAKGVIYSYGLVDEITRKFNLDFSNRVSITFQKVVFKQVKGYNLAMIELTK